MSEQLPPTTPTTTTDPMPYNPAPKGSMDWAGTASLICGAAALLTFCVNFFAAWIPFIGVLSMCCCWMPPLLSLLGIVFGFLGFKSEKKNFAMIGLALSALAAVLYVVVWALAFFGIALISSR